MGPNPMKLVGGAVIAAALLAPMPALSQWNDQPFQFRNSGAGAGMSMAYRQGIIIQELEGRRPDIFLRGADGRLLEVTRFRRQAFAFTPQPDYLPVPFIAGRQAVRHPVAAAQSPIDAWVAMLD